MAKNFPARGNMGYPLDHIYGVGLAYFAFFLIGIRHFLRLVPLLPETSRLFWRVCLSPVISKNTTGLRDNPVPKLSIGTIGTGGNSGVYRRGILGSIF